MAQIEYACTISRVIDADLTLLTVNFADFYVVQKNWIQTLLTHMEEKQLAFFGSQWHPRWGTQYRYFPTIHFMMIDLERVSKSELNFKPKIKDSVLWKIIKYPIFKNFIEIKSEVLSVVFAFHLRNMGRRLNSEHIQYEIGTVQRVLMWAVRSH